MVIQPQWNIGSVERFQRHPQKKIREVLGLDSLVYRIGCNALGHSFVVVMLTWDDFRLWGIRPSFPFLSFA